MRALKAEGLGVADIVRRTGISRASVYRVLEAGEDAAGSSGAQCPLFADSGHPVKTRRRL